MASVGQIFAEAGLEAQGQAQWGSVVPLDSPGVYVVATTEDVHERGGLDTAPISAVAVAALLDVRPELRVDGGRPTVEELATGP